MFTLLLQDLHSIQLSRGRCKDGPYLVGWGITNEATVLVQYWEWAAIKVKFVVGWN